MGLIRLRLNGENEEEARKKEEPKVEFSPTLPQFYKTLIAILSLLGTSFYLGFLFHSYLSQATLDKKDVDLAQVSSELNSVRKSCPVQRKKEDFLALRSRVQHKKAILRTFPSNKALQNEVKEAEQQFASYLVSNVNKEADESGVPVMRIVPDDKDARNSKVKFRGEEESYDVPESVKKKSADSITWSNARTSPLENIKRGLLTPRERGRSPQITRDAILDSTTPADKSIMLPTQRERTEEQNYYYPSTIRIQH